MKSLLDGWAFWRRRPILKAMGVVGALILRAIDEGRFHDANMIIGLLAPKCVPPMGPVRRFCFYFYFVGWDCLSLGFHVCLSMPNIEIHLPFGFVRAGWCEIWPDVCNEAQVKRRTFGYEGSI